MILFCSKFFCLDAIQSTMFSGLSFLLYNFFTLTYSTLYISVSFPYFLVSSFGYFLIWFIFFQSPKTLFQYSFWHILFTAPPATQHHFFCYLHTPITRSFPIQSSQFFQTVLLLGHPQMELATLFKILAIITNLHDLISHEY